MRERSRIRGWERGAMWGCERLGTEVLMEGVEVRRRGVSSGYCQSEDMYTGEFVEGFLLATLKL